MLLINIIRIYFYYVIFKKIIQKMNIINFSKTDLTSGNKLDKMLSCHRPTAQLSISFLKILALILYFFLSYFWESLPPHTGGSHHSKKPVRSVQPFYTVHVTDKQRTERTAVVCCMKHITLKISKSTLHLNKILFSS